MATGNESKIDTKLFAATADAAGAAAKELELCFQDWIKIMQSLRASWQGDTSDNIKNTAAAVQNSAAELTRSLGGYKAALNEMAGIYDTAEKKVQETSKTLKFDKVLR